MTEDDVRRIVREELAAANKLDLTVALNAANVNAKAFAMRAAMAGYDRRRHLGT